MDRQQSSYKLFDRNTPTRDAWTFCSAAPAPRIVPVSAHIQRGRKPGCARPHQSSLFVTDATCYRAFTDKTVSDNLYQTFRKELENTSATALHHNVIVRTAFTLADVRRLGLSTS